MGKKQAAQKGLTVESATNALPPQSSHSSQPSRLSEVRSSLYPCYISQPLPTDCSSSISLSTLRLQPPVAEQSSVSPGVKNLERKARRKEKKRFSKEKKKRLQESSAATTGDASTFAVGSAPATSTSQDGPQPLPGATTLSDQSSKPLKKRKNSKQPSTTPKQSSKRKHGYQARAHYGSGSWDGGSPYDCEEMWAQGVKPWDDDASVSRSEGSEFDEKLG